MSELPDYKKLIDDEVWAFIERTDSWYPADTVDRGIDEQRSIYTAMCQEFQTAYPAGIQVEDDLINFDGHDIPVRRYVFAQNSLAAHIVYIHGGGFVVGGLDSHDDVCAELCAQTKMGVTSVDYRLSPEHKHPIAFVDCLNAVQYEAERLGRPLLLCGDSAGGNLCAAVSHHLRRVESHSPIKGQVLIYPGLGVDNNAGSYLEHAQAPMLTRDDVSFYSSVRVDGLPPVDDPSFAPLNDTDFSNLPPTLVLSAECDPLSDDGRLYCDAINHAGGQAQWCLEAGLVHGYLRARHSSARAKQSFNTIVTALCNFANM